MEHLQEIYCAYTEAVARAAKNASPIDGILGFRGGVKDDPCHREFYAQVEKWVDGFLARQPDGQEAAEAVRFILVAAAAHKGQHTYNLCLAAQGHAQKLIALLDQEACAALRQEYDSLYPESARLPVNTQIYEMLCAGAGIKATKKGLLSFLK